MKTKINVTYKPSSFEAVDILHYINRSFFDAIQTGKSGWTHWYSFRGAWRNR